ncbi:capsular polysaccharide biosynthesis protein [Pseudomonas syringae]|uniref:capsular polysaccharide biosynthesis protein n=1 Tax=Pseudomonas syringae TaxID=317 RepID=UPI00067B03DE|nr:capsular polysaccharide biosynthesis protein [Pseudomonas syringae]
MKLKLETPILSDKGGLPRLLATSKGLQGISTLPSLLHDYQLLHSRDSAATKADAVLVWGRKPSYRTAKRIADKFQLPLVTIEDGFLRSIKAGPDEPPLSLVIDNLGIYFDASAPSLLEQLIAQPLTASVKQRGLALKLLWQSNSVSKYNAARIERFVPKMPCVLVADQTLGDASLQGAGVAEFQQMLQAALLAFPQCEVLLKVHPDVIAGRKKGHFNLTALRQNQRVKILDQDIHPAELLPHMHAVFVMTSQLGFDALLWDVPVYTFGMPFYAGYGLTRDALSAPLRRQPASLAQLIHATLVLYSRYVHPETGTLCTPEELIVWLGLQRHKRSCLPVQLQVLGFTRWKLPHVRRFFDGSVLHLSGQRIGRPNARHVVTWGCKHDAALDGKQVSVIRVEDGFLRSVGLGSAKNRPLSWVIDDLGIYYDATRPSRLEHILQHGGSTPAQLHRAAALRNAICSAGVTKYNLPGPSWRRPDHAEKVILVTGQVESDASIQFGANSIRTNLQLLMAVRAGNPQAWVLYKPHPEVLTSAPAKGDSQHQIVNGCDEVLGGNCFHQLLNQVDEVHVLTSQSGFEALMRGIPVTTYGQPFYAGWGLTTDIDMSPSVQARRQRRLSLDELVLGTLIHYPTYVSRITDRFTTAEQALLELTNWHEIPEQGTPEKWRHVIKTWWKKLSTNRYSTM